METILVSVLLPAVVDLFRSGIGAISRKFVGLSVDDQIKLDNANVERLKALAQLDNPYGTPSQWVVDVRASFRYIMAGLLIVGGMGLAGYGASMADQALITTGLETAGSPFAFIFGERLWLGLKGGNK